MPLIQMTREIAYAIGLDAGNVAMRAGGRTAWSEDDYAAASAAFAKYWPLCPHKIAPEDLCSICDEAIIPPGHPLSRHPKP